MLAEPPPTIPLARPSLANWKGGDIDGFLLRPMNCPMHIKIYESEPHSYRDLPVRLAEFGTVYRWEQSGELNGMMRVRGFTQDDAHIFCTEEQLADEIQGCLDLVNIVFGTLGMKDYSVRVSLAIRIPTSTLVNRKTGTKLKPLFQSGQSPWRSLRRGGG